MPRVETYRKQCTIRDVLILAILFIHLLVQNLYFLFCISLEYWFYLYFIGNTDNYSLGGKYVNHTSTINNFLLSSSAYVCVCEIESRLTSLNK